MYLGISEPAELMELPANILAADWLDLAITNNAEVLAAWPTKAVKMAFGSSWLLGRPLCVVEKRFGISFLCGFKDDRPGHKLRREIWKRQEELYIPRKFWISGRGGPEPVDGDNEIFPVSESSMKPADKWPLFAPWQFNIAVESARENDYFTEKLVDCFLSKTVPVYWGCPNIGEYFDTAGMILVENADDLFNKLRALPPDAYAAMQDAIEKNFKKAQWYAKPLDQRISVEIDFRLGETTATAAYWKDQPAAAYEAHGEVTGNPEGWDIVTMASSMLRDTLSVTDWGCGTGRYAKGFRPQGYTGVDINAAALDAARQNNPRHKFVLGESFPATEGYLLITVLLHMPDEDVRWIVQRIKGASARVIVVGEILGREWRRDGEPRVWNRELEEYIALFGEHGYQLTDIYSKPCDHYAKNPAWDRMNNRNVHLLRFEIPRPGHRAELANALVEGSAAVEVGVWEGVFSRSLLSIGKGTVYSVDPWAMLPEYKDFTDSTPDEWEARHERVKALLVPYGPRSVILRTTSHGCRNSFADGSLDLVYLDANHVYEAITEDIALWWPKVKPGGVLAGHDFTTNPTCGVELAVNEFCAREKLALSFLHDFGPPTWVVRKPCPV